MLFMPNLQMSSYSTYSCLPIRYLREQASVSNTVADRCHLSDFTLHPNTMEVN